MKKLLLTILFTLVLNGVAIADAIHFICKPIKLEGQKPADYDPELTIDLENNFLRNNYNRIPISYIGERKIKAKDWYAEYEFDRISGEYSQKPFVNETGYSELRWQCEKAKPKI